MLAKSSAGVTFIFDPGPHANPSWVAVAGSFNNWNPDSDRLPRGADGLWRKTLTLPAGRHSYKFVVDGHWQTDPDADGQVPNDQGGENSVVHVPHWAVPSAAPTVPPAAVPAAVQATPTQSSAVVAEPPNPAPAAPNSPEPVSLPQSAGRPPEVEVETQVAQPPNTKPPAPPRVLRFSDTGFTRRVQRLRLPRAVPKPPAGPDSSPS